MDLMREVGFTDTRVQPLPLMARSSLVIGMRK
jgi:hypothetical protein